MTDERRDLILVVEDSRPMRELVEEYLVQEGYTVDTAETGEIGIQLIAERDYSLVLTDLRLPGADGFAIIEAANERLPMTPKILMTAYSDMNDALRALRLGAYDFLQKPIRNMWELGLLVGRALEHYHLLVEGKNQSAEIARMNGDLRRLNDNLEDEVRARTEELSRANRELRTLDEMKNNLLANVSHELRTPLVSVRGYTELFLTGRLCPIPDQYMEFLETSLRNIDKLLTLIDSLVNYAELARDGVDLELEELDLCALVRETLAERQGDIAAAGLIVEDRISDSAIEINVDRQRIAQALWHVLDNAIKFTESGGVITVIVDHVSRRLAKVTIKDTGLGIDHDHQMRIFERFYQVDSSSTRHHGGTGIGLAIARDNLRLLGCELRVSSEPGEGSTFYFTIPTNAEASDGKGARI